MIEMDRERLEHLLNRHFDQLLEVGQLRELEQMLLESPEARKQFWEMARINAALRQWGQEEWGRRDATMPHVVPAPRKAVPNRQPPVKTMFAPWWPMAAAAVLVIGFAVWFLLPQKQASERAFAVLTSTSQAVWAEGTPEVGGVLGSGWMKLESGFVRIEFLRGARMVIEGPAEFRLLSDNATELRNGKLSAAVPLPALGFQVTGGDLTVVDYGTEFSCVFPAEGPPEVHVFSGEVEVRPLSKSIDGLMLSKNEAVRLDVAELERIPADKGLFVDEAELARIDHEASHERFEQWKKFSREVRQRQDVVAYLDFEPRREGERSLKNKAVNADPASVAAIVGATWTEGRWSEKSALEFKGADDRVRLVLPGEFESLTFFAWIRVDETPNRLNGLVMGQTGDQLGETHWYVYLNGALGAAVRIAPRGHDNQWWHAHSEPYFKGQKLGKWTFVATVLDRRAGIATHYIDGVPVARVTRKSLPSLRLGTVEIANWAVNQQVVNERGFFRGRIDELGILSSALSQAEIQKVFEAGRTGDFGSR